MLAYPLRVSEMLDILGDHVCVQAGPIDRMVDAVAALDDSDAVGTLSFSSQDGIDAIQAIAASGAGVVVCRPEIVYNIKKNKTLIGVDNPRLGFIRLVAARAPMAEEETTSIHDSASIDPSAVLGERVRIGASAVIGPRSRIGDFSRIDAGAVIYGDTRIGARCIIQAGAMIGAEGYGFERDEDGHLHRFPQFGHVYVEDDVDIGARACIDRGALGETRIGRGSKIDDGAYIAHNVDIGHECLIMAQTVLCGSCVIGDRVEISPGAIIRDKIRIGDDARVGLGSVVVKDVSAGITVAGAPARPLSA